MEAPGIRQADFHALDATFHVTLVRTAGNPLLNLVEDAVDGLLRKVITDLALIAWDWEAVRPRLSPSTARSTTRSWRATASRPPPWSRGTSATGGSGCKAA